MNATAMLQTVKAHSRCRFRSASLQKLQQARPAGVHRLPAAVRGNPSGQDHGQKPAQNTMKGGNHATTVPIKANHRMVSPPSAVMTFGPTLAESTATKALSPKSCRKLRALSRTGSPGRPEVQQHDVTSDEPAASPTARQPNSHALSSIQHKPGTFGHSFTACSISPTLRTPSCACPADRRTRRSWVSEAISFRTAST